MQRNSRETTAAASKRNGIRAKPQRKHRNQKAPSHRARRWQPKWPPQKRPEEATRGRNSRETTAGASKCNGIRAKPQRQHRNATEFARNHSGSIETKRPRPTARAVGNLSGIPRRGLKRPREAGIRAKPQREHRNATEFARNHGGSIETQRNSRETTAGVSKPRPRPTVRAVAVGNLSGTPRRGLKRSREPEFARNHSGSIETKRPRPTARAVAVGNLSGPPQKAEEAREAGIRTTPQREHRNATEFARNHSGSIEKQRNSRETTAGASKPRPRLTARAVAVGNLSGPPRRGLKRPREAGIRAKPQREHRSATEFARNHSGSIETQRNSRETTAGASKPRPRLTTRAVAVGNLSGPPRRGLKRPREAGIRAKPQGEHRNATEFARNHSGSIEKQRNSRETTAGASKPRPRPTAARAVAVSNQFL